MNAIVKEVIKITLVGGALAAALTGCCLWNSDGNCCTCGKSAAACHCKRPARATGANLCNDRGCSNASAGNVR